MSARAPPAAQERLILVGNPTVGLLPAHAVDPAHRFVISRVLFQSEQQQDMIGQSVSQRLHARMVLLRDSIGLAACLIDFTNSAAAT